MRRWPIPSTVEKFDAAGLQRRSRPGCGLESLEPMLDVSKRWDRELNEDEQQRLAFATLLLHAPHWVLIDEVLDAPRRWVTAARERGASRRNYRAPVSFISVGQRGIRPAVFPRGASGQGSCDAPAAA